jgi:hypothetical protein
MYKNGHRAVKSLLAKQPFFEPKPSLEDIRFSLLWISQQYFFLSRSKVVGLESNPKPAGSGPFIYVPQ